MKVKETELRGKEILKLKGFLMTAEKNGLKYLLVSGQNSIIIKTWEPIVPVDETGKDRVHQLKRKVRGYVGRKNPNGNIYLPTERSKRSDWFAKIRTPSWNPKRGHGTKTDSTLNG